MNKEIKSKILETTLKDWRINLEQLYDQAYWQGYNDGAAMNGNFTMPLAGKPFVGCATCGLDATKGAWGYVCSRSDCPIRISY